MRVRVMHARYVCPRWPRVLLIETRNFALYIPLPWLELYRFKPDPTGLKGDVIPVRLIPPDAWWRDQDSQT